ncbi:phospholipase-like protein, partial [Tanacetum coccineum]
KEGKGDSDRGMWAPKGFQFPFWSSSTTRLLYHGRCLTRGTKKVYDAKVSIRCKLHILQTIRSKLSWKVDRLGMFSRTVFGPWLNIQTTLHDNHLLNFLLQHQRYVEDPSIDIPFIFDIDGRTLELGRQDFCLITGFRFGKISLDPKEKDRSQFRERVFPETPNLNGQLLLDLVKNDVAFNNLDDDDVVRVCLLLALDYVFMGQEIKHVLLKPIVNLVDNLSEWDKFPWGEYMWREFHKRVYNVVAKHREYHLKMLGNNPRYVANYALYGFVFPLKIWGLETFSNSIHWWRKDENAIPRGVAWSNGLNLEYFTKVTTPNPVLRSATRGSSSSRSFHTCVRTEVRREVHVRTEVHSFVEEEVCTQSVDKEDVPEIVVLEKNVKEQQMQIVDMQRRLLSLEDITKRLNNGPSQVDHNVDNNVDHIVGDRVVLDKIFKEQQLQILDMQRRLLSLEHITKTQNNGLSEPDHNVDHLDKVLSSTYNLTLL